MNSLGRDYSTSFLCKMRSLPDNWTAESSDEHGQQGLLPGRRRTKVSAKSPVTTGKASRMKDAQRGQDAQTGQNYLRLTLAYAAGTFSPCLALCDRLTADWFTT
jgi:hypothetical protein